jgi:hypothetical protein
VIPGVKGRTVAVVGRAASSCGSENGPAIDACDVVVRINWTLPIPPIVALDVGARTDVIYHCHSVCEGARTSAEAHGVTALRLDPKYRLQLTKEWGFDVDVYRPNTGTVAVLDAIDSGAREVRVFSMDLFHSGHFSGPAFEPPDNPGWKWSHDPRNDRAILRTLLDRGQIIPDDVLRAVLEASL